MQDIYAGDFLVVGLTEDDFGSLTSEQMQKFEEKFHQPQMFVRMGRSIMAIPVPDDMVKKMEEKAPRKEQTCTGPGQFVRKEAEIHAGRS